MNRSEIEIVLDSILNDKNQMKELKEFYLGVSNWFVGNVMEDTVMMDELKWFYFCSLKYQYNYVDEFLKRNYDITIDESNYKLTEKVDKMIRNNLFRDG